MVGSSETDSSSSPPASSTSNDPSLSLPILSVSGIDTPSAEIISSPTPSDRVDHEPVASTTTTTTPPTSINRRVDSPPSEASSSAHVRAPSRAMSTVAFVSSPLNPNAPSPQLRSSHHSKSSTMHIPRVASEETQALAAQYPFAGTRGSMVLYYLTAATSTSTDPKDTHLLQPPKSILPNRDSTWSASGDSIFSFSSDSKYPYGAFKHGALVPYAMDPDVELTNEPEDDDFLHDPEDIRLRPPSRMNLRAVLNVGSLFLLVLGLMFLFIFYPVYHHLASQEFSAAIVGNTLVNSTGQVSIPGSLYTLQVPLVLDPDTPASVLTRIGFDNYPYDLVFSDEFNKPGRSFWPGDDPYWEAANLGTTHDKEYYDPAQVTTKQGGYLSIMMENEPEHGLGWRSGMLQSWNKFCFTRGYIEVAISLPGSVEAQGYWPGAWTMGNLARPGYPATADGVWPYSYNSCDVGTFPNQTYTNGSGPAAALQSDASLPEYNNSLSWLPGQRLSSCTCSGEDHPGPSTSVGRGAPEIDILEVEQGGITGQMLSQSAQVAPFTHDYLYQNDTQDNWHIYSSNITMPNSYHGSVHQQSVSALTQLPTDIFQGSGSQFTTFGFEYWSDPQNASDGYIIWQTGGQPTARMGAGALGPDLGVGGSQVEQRLISVEPMSIVLNLGMSPKWQPIDTSTLTFPAEMRVDYVRVYQRRGETNIGCDPNDYPTADYINRHMDTYKNPNLTAWNHPKPRNSLYAGGC